MVAMNAETYGGQDVAGSAGGSSTTRRGRSASSGAAPDVTFLGVPLGRMCNEAFNGVRERILMKNVAYAGALAALLEIDITVVDELLAETYAKKKAAAESNRKASALGYDYARQSTFRARCCPQRMSPTAESIPVDGNTATALGCLYAGATVAAWYPITPRPR